MTQTSYPFDSQDTTEAQFGRWAREFQSTGVADSFGGSGLKVSGTSSGMTVSVQPGFAIVRGTAYMNDAVITVPVDAVGGARADRVVLQLNPLTNTTTVVLKKGSGPTPPPLVQTDVDLYEMPLATINMSAGAVTISAADVTDERPFVGSTVTGWSTATRPASPRLYRIGFNTSLGRYEYWNGTAWNPLVADIPDTTSLPRGVVNVFGKGVNLTPGRCYRVTIQVSGTTTQITSYQNATANAQLLVDTTNIQEMSISCYPKGVAVMVGYFSVAQNKTYTISCSGSRQAGGGVNDTYTISWSSTILGVEDVGPASGMTTEVAVP